MRSATLRKARRASLSLRLESLARASPLPLGDGNSRSAYPAPSPVAYASTGKDPSQSTIANSIRNSIYNLLSAPSSNLETPRV